MPAELGVGAHRARYIFLLPIAITPPTVIPCAEFLRQIPARVILTVQPGWHCQRRLSRPTVIARRSFVAQNVVVIVVFDVHDPCVSLDSASYKVRRDTPYFVTCAIERDTGIMDIEDHDDDDILSYKRPAGYDGRATEPPLAVPTGLNCEDDARRYLAQKFGAGYHCRRCDGYWEQKYVACPVCPDTQFRRHKGPLRRAL